MAKKHILRLHWRLFFPLVGLLWLIIGLTIIYSVNHEKLRQKENLENRLLNVNNTVVDAYDHGVNLQNTVDFIKLFTNNTTLDPLRITVYDDNGNMIADNPATTILIHDSNGNIDSKYLPLWHTNGSSSVVDIDYYDNKSMISAKTSDDGRIHSFAALPYNGKVTDFLRTDPTVWLVVIILGLLSSLIAFFGVKTICRNVYALRDFAEDISSDRLPESIDPHYFSNDELGDVSRNLLTIYREKLHAEHEKIRHERRIIMNISHELNTPVGIIKGYLDTILSDDTMSDDLRRKFLTRAQQNTDRLTNLINDIIMISRLQSNKNVIECIKIDFHDIAFHLAEDISLGKIAGDMEFNIDVPEGTYIIGHEALLTNALLNLVNNAAKHSGGTQISLRWIGKEEKRHVFTFADNGVGVDQEHLPRLFDLFYRVDSGRSRKKGGSGLGLPLVHKIILSMGGDISVENAENGGLKFTFSIPSA